MFSPPLARRLEVSQTIDAFRHREQHYRQQDKTNPLIENYLSTLINYNNKCMNTITKSNNIIPYSGKFSREKIFTNFVIYSHPQKFSPQNFRHATSIMQSVLTFHESFLREMLPSYIPISESFSLVRFPAIR